MNLISRSHALPTGLACLATVLALSTSVVGQCLPFSRMGMKPLSTWTSGSELQLGVRAADQPGLSLFLTHDAGVGARLVKSSHRHRRSDGRLQVFDFLHGVPPGLSPQLWSAVLRPLGDETPYPVGPAQAQGFRIWVNRHGPSHDVILSWDKICVPGIQCAQDFWFELRIRQLVRDPQRFEFRARMARYTGNNGGTRMTMDEVQAPIIHTLQPGDKLKSRLLVPAAQNLPLPASNMTMSAWEVLGGAADLEHPARGQQMQFSALYAGDPTAIDLPTEVLSAHQKILYFSTEDREGYYKRFKHNVLSFAGLAIYRWAPTYFPEYGPTPDLNFFSSPYPAVMSGLHGKSNAWWFDVCAEYRDFVRCRMGLTPVRSRYYRLNRQAAGGESVVVATINLQNDPGGRAPVFADYVDHAINLKEVFRGPSGRPAKVFMEWQKWFNGNAGSGEDLIGPGFNPKPYTGLSQAPKEFAQEALPEIRRGARQGINICLYSVPTLMNGDDWPSFRDAWFLRDRTGAKRPLLDGAYVDFGNFGVPFWFAGRFFDDILDTSPELGGMYLDFFGGEASFLRYPPTAAQQFWNDPRAYYARLLPRLVKQRYHGGSAYVRGGIRTMDLLRGRIRLGQWARRSSERPFLPTEAVMEFFAGHYDIAQHGLKSLPGQTQLSNALDQFAGVTTDPLPVQAAANNPPLWNAVYHEYSRADALGMMLNTEAVAQGLGGGSDAPFPGVDWATWGSYNRMIHALMFIGGMKSSLFSFFQDYADQALVQNGSSGPVLENDAVPQQGELLAFMQRMQQAGGRRGEAAELLNYGAMERPLDLPQVFLVPTGFPAQKLFLPGTLDSVPSPSPTVSALTQPLNGITRHVNEDFFTAVFPSQVPRVFHSVWRRDPCSNRLGLVLVNWTDQPAYWQGTFNPAAYAGFGSGKFRVHGVRPQGGGVESFQLGQGEGATVLGFSTQALGVNLQHHSQAAPGLMPARSVQVIFIDPR